MDWPVLINLKIKGKGKEGKKNSSFLPLPNIKISIERVSELKLILMIPQDQSSTKQEKHCTNTKI